MRFVNELIEAGRYTDSQIDDYQGLRRREFLWKPNTPQVAEVANTMQSVANKTATTVKSIANVASGAARSVSNLFGKLIGRKP